MQRKQPDPHEARAEVLKARPQARMYRLIVGYDFYGDEEIHFVVFDGDERLEGDNGRNISRSRAWLVAYTYVRKPPAPRNITRHPPPKWLDPRDGAIWSPKHAQRRRAH